MIRYNSLSKEIQEEIIKNLKDKSVLQDTAIRKRPGHDIANLWRPAFVRDVEKIINCPYYNRYTDKTQVFSLYKNDDISRRALHVQLVSRIARNIGRLLGLNVDLIEAISLGHDIGHTPFGHAGEKILSDLFYKHTGRYFNHNVHSVRVLDGIFNYNISLQTLDGILCHNGEMEKEIYKPIELTNFKDFDKKVESCYTDKSVLDSLTPSTLEGCVVRVCDMIAYIGKDRQDALKAKIIESDKIFDDGAIGRYNAAIINNLVVNIVENSYGKDYIMLDKKFFNELKKSKQENYKLIYLSDKVSHRTKTLIEPLFNRLYERLLSDLLKKDENSVIYKHHISLVNRNNKFYADNNYLKTEPNQIVVDYIASMTDDYLVDLCYHLFPDCEKIEYISYFDDLKGEKINE